MTGRKSGSALSCTLVSLFLQHSKFHTLRFHLWGTHSQFEDVSKLSSTVDNTRVKRCHQKDLDSLEEWIGAVDELSPTVCAVDVATKQYLALHMP